MERDEASFDSSSSSSDSEAEATEQSEDDVVANREENGESEDGDTVAEPHEGNETEASSSDNHKCPLVAVMFPIRDKATYHIMGGCKEETDTCNRKNRKGHEVDIMHFSIGNAIPG